jgi:hypothetical protein
MTDRQNDKLNMHITTLDYCNANRSVWEHIPVFVRYTGELEGHVNRAKQIVQSQHGIAVKGVTAQKGSAEDTLVQECLTVGGALYAYGFDSGNRALMETAQVNKYALYSMHGQLTLARAKNIAAAAGEHAEKMAEYGIGEAEYNALTGAIAAYEALILSPREAINERKQYTGSLVQALAAADSVLCDKMDRIVVRFKIIHPWFYNGYKDARAVKGGHSSRRTPEGSTPAPETE